MTAVDWSQVDSETGDQFAAGRLSTAFDRGTAIGSLRFRRRLWSLRLAALGVAVALTAASFGVRAAVQGAGTTGADPPARKSVEQAAKPFAASVSPTYGPLRGGNPVIIQGRALGGTAAVYFGDAKAQIKKVFDRHIRVISPPHRAGPIHIRLVGEGTITPRGQGAVFTYIPAVDPPRPAPVDGGGGGGGTPAETPTASTPVVTSVRAPSGPASGGRSVVVNGAALGGVTRVTFGGLRARITKPPSDGQVVISTPSHAPGTVDVVVTSPTGSSDITKMSRYTYVEEQLPEVLRINPDTGPESGGEDVTIIGSGLDGAQLVSFGGITVKPNDSSDGELAVTTPAHDAGVVQVTVTTDAGRSTTSASYEFRAPTPVE
jgi:hypothetical protein